MLNIIGQRDEVDSNVGTEYLPGGPAHNYEILFGGLQQTIVPFVYRKKDGSLRFAVGTTNPDLVPVSGERKAEKLARIAALVGDNSDESGSHLTETLATIKKVIEEEAVPKKSTVGPEYQVYYDFEQKGWRQFHKNAVVLIIAFQEP